MTLLRHWAIHIIQSLLDDFAAVTGFYYSKKYAAIVRRLGLRQTTQDPQQPGLIIIQIDGLAHEHLVRAVEKGRLPYVRRMLRKGDSVLARWRCGLPSTTPACQAGIMFGENYNIPAFRWYDKERRISVVCKQPGTVAHLQDLLAQGRTGILSEGASYVNLFDGGAAESLFTLSDLRPRGFFESVRGIGFVVLFLLNPLRTVRIVYLALKEYVTDGMQRLSSRLRGQSYLPFIGVFPFLRVFSNVVFRDLETFGVLVDIYRGIPAIYATYYGYDEVAHHFGVTSVAARQALRAIDGCIAQIDRLRRANLCRPYARCLLSDHGLTPSEPFVHRYGESLGRYVSSHLGPGTLLYELTDEEPRYVTRTRYLLEELRTIERNLRPGTARVARRIRLLVQHRLAVRHKEPVPWDAQRQHDVIVKSSGSLAHIYFNITTRRMDLSDISVAFPELVLKLLAHQGIWLVAAREGERVFIMGREGVLTLQANSPVRVEGRNPLARLLEPEQAAEQVRRIASFPQAGDLLLFGTYDSQQDLVACFENQWASHGGLGGAQDYPFILYPRDLNWDLSDVRDSRDLYPFFLQLRSRDPIAQP